MALASCAGDGSSPPVVLVIEDGSASDARDVVTPAVLGLRLGLEGSGLELRVVETDGLDPADHTGDPRVVAAAIAPFTDVEDGTLAALGEAGLAVVTLSELAAEGPDGSPAWRALVPPLDAQAATAALVSPTGTTCAAGDGSPWSETFTAELTTVVRLEGGPADAAREAGERACAGVVWTGSATGGLAFAQMLDRAAPEAALILGDRARTPASAEDLASGLAPYALCPCVDLTTTDDEAAQRFVHDYQRSTGLEPGPFAAEGYDAARLVASAALTGSSRDRIAAALASTERFEGLGGAYSWDPSGDLRDPVVRMYQRVGVRWLARPLGRVADGATRA